MAIFVTSISSIFFLNLNAFAYTSSTNLESSDASFLGTEDTAYIGETATIVDDLNGDGIGDLVTSGNPKNKIYIIFGKEDGWANNVAITEADASYVGEAGGCLTWDTKTGYGDVNGDGLGDLFCGSHSKSFNGNLRLCSTRYGSKQHGRFNIR